MDHKIYTKKNLKAHLNHIVNFGPQKIPSNEQEKKLRDLLVIVEELTKRVDQLIRRYSP